MPAGINPILATIIFLFLCTAAVAASIRRGDAWNYYHFDGSGFVAGKVTDGSIFVAVSNGVRPVVLTHTERVETMGLPPDTGAVAGICYIQTSGGKLAGGAGYLPCPHMQLAVSSGNRVVTTVQTDEQGYFVVVLPAGRYIVGEGPLAREVRVKKDQTSLVALRLGKRMVD